MKVVGRADRTKFRNGVVKPLIEMGLLELTIPDKPRSRMQRYRTTEEGLATATGHASRQPPVSGSLAPDSGRMGGPSRTKKGKGRQ
jgi:hypothetical protein